MTDRDAAANAERNLRLYDWLLPLSRIYFWTPVFFLYFSQRFAIADVLRLEALYYATVVLLEVPSGYFSDRIGRRATLIVSCAAGVLSYALFLAGGASFGSFALAQIAKAVSYAFLSGTDTSFHFDVLAGADRAQEYAGREARLARNGFLGGTLAAVLAGIAGSVDLRIPYALALLNALVMLRLAVALREPPRHAGGFASVGLAPQIRACLAYLKTPSLAWVFGYFLLKTTMEHVPYEFAQPYIAAALGEPLEALQATPMTSGLLVGGVAAVASVAAGRSVWLRDRVGLRTVLIAVGLLQLALIAAMSATISYWVIGLLLLRSVQSAVANPLINAAVTPLVAQDKRATYLSIHSLAGRLGYSGMLFSLGAITGGASATEPAVLSQLLGICGWVSAIGLALLAIASRFVRDRPA